ncbi:hypothetical protein B0J13DRAFT_561442 [Dactylonectria estremocensis]|uniref:Secreted protein n=1 Tax=Dactylonectria estremocensis TaxID=1079267 RepID=A0A9P9E6Z4_9HYPO|nr:hypothetical protein B0J13DRAFT_561442 [Dactylonectria estremocensis]
MDKRFPSLSNLPVNPAPLCLVLLFMLSSPSFNAVYYSQVEDVISQTNVWWLAPCLSLSSLPSSCRCGTALFARGESTLHASEKPARPPNPACFIQ